MAKKKKVEKTNAVRQLDQAGMMYELYEYDVTDGQLDGISVANKTGQAEQSVYKTLVTVTGPRTYAVFLLPVAQELDLKKAAKAAGVKKLEMLPLKDLLQTTGYIRGGCSAIGMKKRFPTYIDESAESLAVMIASAGKPGLQMAVAPQDLAQLAQATFYDLVK